MGNLATLEKFLERKLEHKIQEVKVLKEEIKELQKEIKELEEEER